MFDRYVDDGRVEFGADHSGKGPRGWRRSDARIREDLCAALARHPDLDASDLEVEVRDGEASLYGTVTDRRQKYLAMWIADGVEGVRDVHTRIRVGVPPDPTDDPETPAGPPDTHEVGRFGVT